MKIFLASCLLTILIHTKIITGAPATATAPAIKAIGSAGLPITAALNSLTAIPSGTPTNKQLSTEPIVVELQYVTATGLSEVSVNVKLATILVSATESYLADSFPNDVPFTYGLSFCENQEKPSNGWVCMSRNQAPTGNQPRIYRSWYGPPSSATSEKNTNRNPVGKRDTIAAVLPTSNIPEPSKPTPNNPVTPAKPTSGNVKPRSHLEERADPNQQIITKALESFVASGWPKEGTPIANGFSYCENLVIPVGNIVQGGTKQSCWTFSEYKTSTGRRTGSWYSELATNTAKSLSNDGSAQYAFNKLGWMILVTGAALAGAMFT